MLIHCTLPRRWSWMLIHWTLPRRRAWMQIHCPLPRQRGQDRRILPSLPSACGHARRSDGFVRGYVQQQRAGCKSTAHFQDDGRAWMHIHYPLPGQRGQDRTNHSALRACIEWVGCSRRGQYSAILPALPRQWGQWIHVHARRLGSELGFSHGHRATAALRHFLDKYM